MSMTYEEYIAQEQIAMEEELSNQKQSENIS